jgi:hypothetical protein
MHPLEQISRIPSWFNAAIVAGPETLCVDFGWRGPTHQRNYKADTAQGEPVGIIAYECTSFSFIHPQLFFIF